jgi:hypothetical protein
LSSDEPGQRDWASPGSPAPPPPYYVPAGSAPTSPPPPPPPGYGWPAQPPPPPYGWAPQVPQAPKPGIIPLRPLAVGEILDGAFTTIRRYPAATLGLAAAVMVVVEAITVVFQYYLLHGVSDVTTLNANNTLNTNNNDFLSRSLLIDVGIFVVTLAATALLSGMLAAVVGRGALGRPMSAGDAWAATRAAFPRLFGTTVLIFLIEIVLFVIGALPGTVVIAVGSTGLGIFLIFIGELAAFVGFVYVQTALLFATPIVMLEQQRIWAAISRSRALITGAWWRTFGIWLLSVIIADVVASIIVVPFALAGGIGGVFSGHPTSQFTFGHLLITGVGGFLGATLVRPFASAVIALLYLDRRMRAEALDLTLQQAAATGRP